MTPGEIEALVHDQIVKELASRPQPIRGRPATGGLRNVATDYPRTIWTLLGAALSLLASYSPALARVLGGLGCNGVAP